MDLYKFLYQQDNYRAQIAEGISNIYKEAHITGHLISSQHPLKIKTVIWHIPQIEAGRGSNDPGDGRDHMQMVADCSSGSQDKPADDDHIIQLKGLIVIPDQEKTSDNGQHDTRYDGAGTGKYIGAVQKAGRAIVTDVCHYGERVRQPGLTLLEAPGNDAVSSTALAAAGATAILFTTGRGTPLGFPVPTIKIASNSALAERKPGWIDFDAGRVLEDGMDKTADALLDTVVAVASGKETAAERNGEREIAIWKRGVTL